MVIQAAHPAVALTQAAVRLAAAHPEAELTQAEEHPAVDPKVAAHPVAALKAAVHPAEAPKAAAQAEALRLVAVKAAQHLAARKVK